MREGGKKSLEGEGEKNGEKGSEASDGGRRARYRWSA